MIWITIANNNLNRAFILAETPGCDAAALKALQKGFRAFPWSETAPRRPLIGEYVGLQGMTRTFGSKILRSDVTDQRKGQLDALLLDGYFHLTYLPNRTARDHRIILDRQLANMAATPPREGDVAVVMKEYAERPPAKNAAGWLTLLVAVPDFSKAIRTCYETTVRSELLAVYLAGRSGETLTLNDPFTGKPYGRTESGVPFSVGWDHKAGTKDDIVLGTTP